MVVYRDMCLGVCVLFGALLYEKRACDPGDRTLL